MFDGLGKAFLWILAIVGGVVVVRKYGPGIMESMKGNGGKALPAGSAAVPAKGLSAATGAILVPCSAVGHPGPEPLHHGVQSSPFYRWCYLVRGGDSAGSISERVTGDSSRYAEILIANPDIAKKGKMGTVVGPDAWDFADGVLAEGTKVFVPQTMNAWIDQFGQSRGSYLPWPPDPRMIVEVDKIDMLGSSLSTGAAAGGAGSASGAGDIKPVKTHVDTDIFATTTAKGMSTSSSPGASDGFDYEEETAEGTAA